MPEPKKGEPLNQFVARFMPLKREKRSYADLKQGTSGAKPKSR